LAGIEGPDDAAASAVTVERDGMAPAVGVAGFGRPYRHGQVWVAQRAIGPALAATAHDAEGRPLLLQVQGSTGDPSETAHLLFTAYETEQTFAVPEQDLTFRVVSYPALPERGIGGPVFLVEAYDADQPAEPVLDQLVPSEAGVELDGATYSFQRSRYVALEVSHQPGALVLLLGWSVILAGVLLVMWWPRLETWVQMDATAGAVTARGAAGGPGVRVPVGSLLPQPPVVTEAGHEA
jgi:hypothetical protein